MRIDLAGRRVGYEDSEGGGTPLVLLHGFPLDRSVWGAQVKSLAGVARVIAPDLRGFGESALEAAAGDDAVSIEGYAQDTARLLDALGIESAIVAGVSMGGYVALAFHRLFPRRTRALVLVDTRSTPDSPAARSARDEAITLVRERGTAALATRMAPQLVADTSDPRAVELRARIDALMAAQSPDGVAAALRALRDRPDATPGLRSIAVPVLVVTGADDTIVTPEESRGLAAAIPGAELVVIPGAAHLPAFERPDAFDAAVQPFLARCA